ncbi:MAG: prolyl oligopeptidase family serine peptidase [Planctomycetia bacterium]|nr:prolyl oligopeptidase family serine peptidase [Planctomycetia bacterium]
MAIRVECSGCQKTYRVADSNAGKMMRCHSCGSTTRIPESEAPDDDADFADLSEDEGADDVAQDDSDDSIFGSRSAKPAPKRLPADDAEREVRRPAKAGSSNAVKWLLIIAGSAGALLLVCCGGVYYFVSSMMKPPAASAQASEPFPVESIRTPAFPELGQAETMDDTGVQVYQLDLAAANAGNSQPAARMQLRVYLPPGEHAAGSLGCVLVAPAGTNLLTGNGLDDPDYHSEALPYALAGYAVVTYSLDGALTAGLEDASDSEMSTAYRAFSAAFGGLANARAALEFVLARLPQVDARRIFAAGHSSAGTLSLLFAEHEPRLKGCIAYAPQPNVEEHLSAMLRLLTLTGGYPGIVDFVRRSSPQTHMARIKCPVFLFWSADDSVVTPHDIQRFATDLGKLRQDVTVKTVPTGDHFNSMVDPGMGLAIEWLKTQPGEKPPAP